jgi:uncharacterized protein
LNFAHLPISKLAAAQSAILRLIMRNLIAGSLTATALTFALFGVPVLAADADPTVREIYSAAASGHLDQAQQMMNQVLRDHPGSAKAHFVQAELYAREGNIALARSEFNQAEQLKPGLPDESQRAVQELKAQLGLGAQPVQGGRPFVLNTGPATPRFPWGTVLILALVVGVFWMLFRRRNRYAQYPTSGMPVGGAPGTYGPGGYPGGAMGGGLGSNIAGGLAGGLAAGAGIVAGEELAHHFLDGGQRSASVLPPANDNGEWNSSNNDMGGTDFGVNDPGSWDDGSGGGGFGGGDSGGGDWS